MESESLKEPWWLASAILTGRLVGALISLLFIPLLSSLHLSTTQLAWPGGN